MARPLEVETVIVGGGSAGCAIAGRLAESGSEILLLEAGPDYGAAGSGDWPTELIDARMLATSHDWGYRSGRWQFQRARVIGGCSSHNGAIAAVGHRRDYDDWGVPGWASADVEPVLKRVIERMRVRTYAGEEVGPFHARCLEAAEVLGWHRADDLCDLDANVSFGLETVNIDGTTRWNTAFAYLDPVRERSNIKIKGRVLVDRFEQHAGVISLFVIDRSEARKITCRQLVLAAGVYGTPAILQRSGVGDPDRLRAVGVSVTVASKNVGSNLHDHPMVHADRTVGPELQNWLDEAAANGFLPEEQTLGKAISSCARDGIYDTHIFPVCASDQTSVLYGRVHVEVACMTPRSRGRFDIASRDPEACPRIDHAYLSDPDDHDITVLRDGLVRANELLDQAPLAAVLGEPISDTSSFAAIRNQVEHYYHPVGTCRMGVDEDAVCDPDGRVRGLDGVVVADASLMPQITRGNTNLPTIMIGERIAEVLLRGRTIATD